MIRLLILSLLSFQALASDLSGRPAAFTHKGKKAVFADFTKAVYHITYDIKAKRALISAEIDFKTAEEGFPIFDSHQAPSRILLDGKAVAADLTMTPAQETQVRIINRLSPAGSHKLLIDLPLVESLEFTPSNVKSAFWMSDLTERGYLERYLPTNFIFDRVPMTLKIKFKGLKAKQNIYTNGSVTQVSDSEFTIVFPDQLNVTCPYFHTTPASDVHETRFSYKSIDGREIPVVIYKQKIATEHSSFAVLQEKTLTYLDELEKDYGPFLHSSLTIYMAGASGGMEYSGATITSEKALGHELFHSYFARGVLPSNGNAGWIDEALASWRDKGYSTLATLSGTSQMAAHGTYNRVTDRSAYSFGERFMSLLNQKTSAKGGLKPFLRELVIKNAFSPLSTEQFMALMSEFYGMDFKPDFERYVFGKKTEKSNLGFEETHPMHQQLGLAEMNSLL
jgi:hypothetical protein